MFIQFPENLTKVTEINFPRDKDIVLVDHLNGFDSTYNNVVLNWLCKKHYTNKIYTEYVIDNCLRDRYKTLDLRFSAELQNDVTFLETQSYKIHPTINYKNFICSFNGTPHISRKLLVSCLQKFGWFNPDYCSKNFSYSVNVIDGHLIDYVGSKNSYYNKFFLSADSEDFFQKIYSFGHIRFKHDKNIYTLENKLTESFLHIVSETLATSYYPFVTEKFLYSIITRGLFLSYAQPGWHDHIEKYHGFKKYTKLFDYKFDSILNPVERLIELMSMISKFSVLSVDDWNDLYLLEQDTIEYNYNHYFSKDYLKQLKTVVPFQ